MHLHRVPQSQACYLTCSIEKDLNVYSTHCTQGSFTKNQQSTSDLERTPRLKECAICNGEIFGQGSVKVEIFSILIFKNIREYAAGPA